MNNQAIENLLRGINKQLGELTNSLKGNTNKVIVTRCNDVGNIVYGLIDTSTTMPTVTYFYIDGLGDIIPYTGAITKCP